MMRNFVYFLMFIILLSCKEKKKAITVSAANAAYLSSAQIAAFVNEATAMDLLFYTMDVSVSQTDKASIQQTVNFISPNAKESSEVCPSIGRLIFQNQGKIILEADIHLKGNCHYFSIVENKIVKGTNTMSSDGVKFLTSLINSYQPKK